MSTANTSEQREVSRTLAEGVPRYDKDRTIWREFTNNAGKKYRVGYHVPANEDFEKAKETVNGLKDPNLPKTTPEGNHHTQKNWAPYHHDIEVHWTYHDGVYYKPSKQVTDKVDITEFQLGWNHGGWYNYELSIYCTVAWNYVFFDQDGYSYGINVDVASTPWAHTVCFDTDGNKEPIITKIHAERWLPPH